MHVVPGFILKAWFICRISNTDDKIIDVTAALYLEIY